MWSRELVVWQTQQGDLNTNKIQEYGVESAHAELETHGANPEEKLTPQKVVPTENQSQENHKN